MGMLPLMEVDWDGDGDGTYGGGGGGRGYDGGYEGVYEGGAEVTWHRPNLMQMVEVLSAAMARGGARRGLDVA